MTTVLLHSYTQNIYVMSIKNYALYGLARIELFFLLKEKGRHLK